MDTEKRIVKAAERLPAGMQAAIVMWADGTTRPTSERRRDLVRDKSRAVADFFAYTGKPPEMVTAIDIKVWQAQLEARGLQPATVYSMVSKISSFYEWALKDEALGERIGGNPVKLARPKAPKAYQAESTKALNDDEVKALLAIVRAKGDLVGKRDYALLLLYLATGLRRAEVIRLRWKDVKVNGGLVVSTKQKGGVYQDIEVADPSVRDAMLDYLEESGRLDSIQADSPLWTRHDRAGKPGKQLTSHAFAKNLKRYAKAAGIGGIHLHQTRHTFARIVAEDSGSIVETQDALGHQNPSTTRVYVDRIAVKRDKWSRRILGRLGV